MVEKEDVVLTRFSLTTEITGYDFKKSIAPVSKYCLPFYLNNNLTSVEQFSLDTAEARTMLNSVVMLTLAEPHDDKIQIVPHPINNITVDHPQTVFLTMRMFPKGQQFHTYSRMYLDSMIDEDLLVKLLNVHPVTLDKSNIISYLSSVFLISPTDSSIDKEIESIHGSQELENIFRRTSLEPSKNWGSIHSRRLARVLFIVCLFLSPIMPFDLNSPECAKLFEPVKKEKLNALFYFINKRDIWFALQTVTNGSISETFSLACACAGISPFILVQLCFSTPPTTERRFVERKPASSFNTTGQCTDIAEIQASTKRMVNLISLSFNYLLLPKPNDDSFAADLRLFYQLALNNSEEQATDLESVLQKFFALDEPIIRRGHSAPLLTQFPRLPTTAPGFSNNSDNPLRVQSSTFKTAQTMKLFENSVLTNQQRETPQIASRVENNSDINPIDNIFGYAARRTSPFFNSINLNNSSFNCIPSTSTFPNANDLFFQSLFLKNSATPQENNNFINSAANDITNKAAKNISTSNGQKSQKPNNSLIFNHISSPHFSRPQSSSSTSPLEIFRNAQAKSFINNELFNLNNFQNSPSSSSSASSSTSPLENNLLGNAQSLLFNRSNFDTNNFQLNNILNTKPSTSFSSLLNNSSNALPFQSSEAFLNKNSSFQLNKYFNGVPSTSISPPKYNAPSLFSKNNDNIINYGLNFNNYHLHSATPNSVPPLNNNASKSFANNSSEFLSTNCNNFQLNHLIGIAPTTKIPNVFNRDKEKTRRLNSEINASKLHCNIIRPSDNSKSTRDNTVKSSSSFLKTRFEESETQISLSFPVKESCHLKVIVKTNEASFIPKEFILPTVDSDSNKFNEEITTSLDTVSMNPNCLEMVHETIDNFYANQKEEREENENKKTEERAIPEESEDAQDFELLIETSFEPLIDDLTSDLIIREQIDDNVNDELDDELDDPDNCPVKCICGFNHLEQQTIFCEKCRIWKHIKCLKAEKYANSEAEYCCPECLGKSLPLSPSEAQDLVSKSLKLEHIDFKNKQCTELKLSGALQFEWKALLENSVDYKTSKVGRLIHEGKMRWAVIKKGQAGRVLAGFGIKAGDAVIGVNGIATYMMDAKNYCTCYRNLNLSFLPEPIIIEMKGRNGGLAHEVLPSCNPNCEIKFCLYKNNLYCYLAALCEIDNDDELTIAFPDTDHLHVNCAESSSNCSNTCPSQKSSKKSKIHASVVKEPPSKKLKRV